MSDPDFFEYAALPAKPHVTFSKAPLFGHYLCAPDDASSWVVLTDTTFADQCLLLSAIPPQS